ncbi:MAG: hypothetical protein M1819_003358 [Sarea resinae]|nr:MAG: hypothetical protein M1819_003358 [Sarea resinae]
MHQHPRTPPVTASPANSPWTNPTRTNNPRDQGTERPRSQVGGMAYNERGTGEGDGEQAVLQTQQPQGQGKESKAKLNQIIQNYHTKAALIIIQSRVSLPPAYARGSETKRVNKWFNVEIDETDVLRDDLRLWKTCDAIEQRPPPLIIETYIDASNLTNNQSLVIIDDQGKRWDVIEGLNSSDNSAGRRASRSDEARQVILERWKIDLGEAPGDLPADLGAVLPAVYKKSIVLFRSLFTYSKFLPAWKFSKKLGKQRPSYSALKVRYRVLSGHDLKTSPKFDALTAPLFPGGGRVTETFSFGATESPAGPFSIQVTYRDICDFRVDDSEALLSSHFMGIDEHYFRPSLGQAEDEQPEYLGSGKEVGSLPSEKKDLRARLDRTQAYGSLSTFHQAGTPASSSPLSALRAARELGPDSSPSSPPQRLAPSLRSVQGSKSSLRTPDTAPPVGRRPSVSFMPFKTPTLSASPSQGSNLPSSSPRNSLDRPSGVSALTQARNRASLGILPQTALRGGPQNFAESAIASSTSTSPKPAPISRYSSSFSHRRTRRSSGAGSRTEDDNNSSGKTSLTSSAAQPGSGILAEVGDTSSGSVQTDDDNISDFLKMLDTKKELKSFHSGDSAAIDASTRRTTAALTKFQRMRDSNAALSESMSSSLQLHRSSSSSSRQLSSVPAMIAGTSLSTSSSPGKPISPHTPHTPAIPSRLSANSIVNYDPQPHRSRSGGRTRNREDRERQQEDQADEEAASRRGAIDIPTSPRPFHPQNRRSSSVAQQSRTIPLEDGSGDLLPFNLRSASMGEDRQPLSLSALLGMQEASEPAVASDEHDEPERTLQEAANPEEPVRMTRQFSSSTESRDESSRPQRGTSANPGPANNSSYRPQLSRGSGRGVTLPQGSFSSAAGDRGSGSGASLDQRGGRYSFSRPSNFEEDEPLLFAMSDFGGQGQQQSRKSLEDARAGSSGGGGESGFSSRRGSSRRGHAWG